MSQTSDAFNQLTQPPQDDPFTALRKAASDLAGSKLARWLLLLFVAVEFINVGVLPAGLQTVATWTALAKSEAAESAATYAKRTQQALARKETGDARHKEQIAVNSPVALAAKTTVAQQQGTINAEKAKQEDRRAAAEARNDAALARIRDVEGKIRAASIETEEITAFFEALNTCSVSTMPLTGGGLFNDDRNARIGRCVRWRDSTTPDAKDATAPRANESIGRGAGSFLTPPRR